MNFLKTSLMLLLMGIILFGCKNKSGIEIVPNLESIYLPINQVDVPAKVDKGFEAEAEKDLVEAVKSVLDKNLNFPLLYKIKIRLFINDKGEIVKLKDMGTSAGYLDSGRNLHLVSIDGLDNSIASSINNWKFVPAVKNGKPIKFWTDFNVDIPIKPDGTYLKFELPDFLSNLPNMNDFVPVDKMPQVVTPINPQYPEDARQNGIEGTAYVKVLVDFSENQN